MNKIIYKGFLSKDNKYPTIDIPEDSKIFIYKKDDILTYIGVVPVLLFLYLVVSIKRILIYDWRLNMEGFWLGVILTIFLIPVHEFIHFLLLPKNSTAYVYLSIGGVTFYPLNPISRKRYIFFAILPGIILGLFPLCLSILLPSKFILISSIVVTASTLSLTLAVTDFVNAILAIIRVPQKGKIQASGNDVYWYV